MEISRADQSSPSPFEGYNTPSGGFRDLLDGIANISPLASFAASGLTDALGGTDYMTDISEIEDKPVETFSNYVHNAFSQRPSEDTASFTQDVDLGFRQLRSLQ